MISVTDRRATPARPPGPRDRIPGASFLAFRRDPPEFLRQISRTYGDLAYHRLGSIDLYLATHPDLVRDVLVTNARYFTGLAFEAGKSVTGEGLLSAQGEAHRRQRRLLQPAFHRDRLSDFASVMVEHARCWSERQEAGEVSLRTEMMRLTLGIIAQTMFGSGEEDAGEDVREFLNAALALFTPFTFPFARVLERLPLPQTRRFLRARARLDDRVYRLIELRRQAEGNTQDLLSILLSARDVEGDGSGLSPRQIRDEVVTFFLAGHETTANALTWCWCLLADHPEAERELHREVDMVLGGRPPRPTDAPDLTYTGWVVAETLRLRPTIPMIFRRVVTPHELGGYVLPRGAVVILSQYVTHRDPRFYPEPDRFDPRRWAPEERAARPKFAFFPFGGGPRVCIGEHFATQEAVLLLATIAQRWRVLPVGDGPAPAPVPAMLTRPPESLAMRLVRRGA